MPKRHGDHAAGLESLFLRLEELVLASSGEDEFEVVFALLVAKLWDERCGRPGRFRVRGSEAETFQAVATLLREADKAWPGVLEPGAPRLRPEHLHVCVEALARHTVSDASLAVMDGFFEFLVSRGAKGAKGQYFTPRHVVEMCVRMLRPRPGETVLDPACGSGGFLVHALNFVRGGLTAEAVREYVSANLWGFDVDARAIRVAKALMVLAGGGGNLVRLNSLLEPAASLAPSGGFDVILTNPPFAGEVRESGLLESYALSRGRRRVERDVLFLERCVELLRPGGRLAIVLPHNKLATQAWGHVREWLLRKARVLAVVGLGRHTFLPHTHQKAGVLFARKLADGESPVRGQRIFFAVSEKDGKTSKGRFVTRPGADEGAPHWDRVEHDLGDVVEAFHEFCRQERLEI
jgi:type I restriction enzyme M protein